MGKAGQDGHVISQGLERLKTFRQRKIVSAAMGKPSPIFVGRVLFERHWHAVGNVETGQAFGIRRLVGGMGVTSQALQPRERQRNARAS
jgi:hypothetical protein